MREKRIIKQLAISLLCVMMSGLFFTMPVLAYFAAPDSEELVVGVPQNRCPLFYRDADTGELVGIGVDLIRSAAQEAGYTALIRPIEEETLKEALDDEAYDILLPFGSAITSASGKESIVSDNLMQTPFTLVTEGSRDRDLPPLNKLKVGMLHSLAAGAETVRGLYPGIEISLYDNMDKCVQALRKGEVDALLHNSYVWSYILQKPAYSDLTVQPQAMFSMDFRAGTLDTPKGRERIERLNEGIAAISDPFRQAVILDYTSRKLYRYDFSDYLRTYGLIIAFCILLLLLIAGIAIQRVHFIRKAHEQRLQQMMDHDPKTGLLSINGFRKRVEKLLREHPDLPYFLSYNNIRDFKFINDSLGRDAGDELLRFWARVSMENLSEEEAVGRVEGDHFATLRHIKGEETMRQDVQNVLTPVQNFFLNQGKPNRVQICSGIYVVSPEDFKQIDVDHMLDLARVAEKRIRDSRKGSYEFYNPEQWEKGKRIAEIINYLPAGIQSGDIQVWYQPQVNYETGEITGAEALCRWEHVKLGWLYPFDFIATLEEAGLIFDLDRFVWETVCKDLKRWNENGSKRTVSVNLSRDDIREDRDLPGYFQNLIRSYDLTPEQLHIEITETAYVEKQELLIETTERLRSMGFQVEMDDFGSGYSSLHMLKEVPVDRIKLDLHFLTASGDPEKSRTIVSCMVQMIRLLGMEMIAEGVETAEQADFLKSKGCSEMQGYYFYKPLPVQEFERVMGEGNIATSEKR